jgi:hypothetical protein
LAITLDNTPEALRRVTPTLGTIPVTQLSYSATVSTQATARITVPRINADRARGKLNRLVEVLAIDDGTARS